MWRNISAVTVLEPGEGVIQILLITEGVPGTVYMEFLGQFI